MAIIGIQDVSVGFGGRPLLEHINLQIEAGERICLLGRNGVGKSTLMRLITGEVLPEEGDILRAPQLTITCLTQEVPKGLSGTVFELISEGLGQCGKLLAEYHAVSHQLALDHDNKSLLAKLDKLQHSLDVENAWQMDRYVENIIENMELDGNAEAASLSAGMKRRVLLAQAIVRKPDVLLLDEPTNHLDIEAVIWIEDFLTSYKGTLIFVSHDRVFVRKLATRIVEIDRGRAVSYFCDYETFLVRRDIANEAQAVTDALFDKKLSQEETWIRKGIKARRTRNEGRVRALEKLRDARAARRERPGEVRMQAVDADRSGRLVLEAKAATFRYEPGGPPVIENLSTTLIRGDKVGIIGPNGSGKTTLLRLLLGELEPQAGSVRHGTRLELAYFDQLHAQLDDEKSAVENLTDGRDRITVGDRSRHVIGYLEDFLFSPE